MGVWNTALDSMEKAKLFIERMSQPWLVVVDEKELLSAPDTYELLGCDDFFDKIDAYYSEGEDIRMLAFKHMYTWVYQQLDTFVNYDEAAVKLLKEGLYKMARQHPEWALGVINDTEVTLH